MRSIQLTIGSLAALATSALIGLAVAAPANALLADAATPIATTISNERGNLLECTGTIKGRAVYASLYENNLYVNVIQILIGDDGDQVGGSREVEAGFIDHRQVRGSLRVDGRKAVVSGTATRVGKRIAVHEEHDDAGQLITIDGYHRRLANDLELTWAGRTKQLTCDNAFFYNLQVTKEDATGD